MLNKTKNGIIALTTFILTLVISLATNSISYPIFFIFLLPSVVGFSIALVFASKDKDENKVYFGMLMPAMVLLILYGIFEYLGLWSTLSILAYVFILIAMYSVIREMYAMLT